MLNVSKKEDSLQQQALRGISPDEIQQFYIAGDLSVAERNRLMRQKAQMQLEDLVGEKGWYAVWDRTAKHAMEGWEKLKEAATHDQTPTVTNPQDLELAAQTGQRAKDISFDSMRELYYGGLAFVATIEMATSALTAVGDVAGVKAEDAGLRMGMSPGLAWLFGRVADIGIVTAVPSNILGRLFATGVKAIAGGKRAAQGAEAAGEAFGADAINEAKHMIALAEGLEKDGVKGAGDLIAQGGKAAGNPTFEEGAKKVKDTIAKMEALSAEQAPSAIQKSMEKAPEIIPNPSGVGFHVQRGLTRVYFRKMVSEPNTMELTSVSRAAGKASPEDLKLALDDMLSWAKQNNVQTIYADITNSKIGRILEKTGLGKIVRTSGPETTWGKNKAVEIAVDDAIALRSKMKDTAARITKSTSETPEVANFVGDAKQIAKNITEEEARTALPALMKKYGVNFNDLKQIKKLWTGTEGKSLTAQEFYGYLKAMEPRAAELSRLAKAAIAPNAPEQAKLDFARYATQLFSGTTDKLRYSREFTNMLMHWDPANVAKGDLSAAMSTFANDMARLTPDQAQKLVIHTQGFGLDWKQTKEIYANMLLPLSWAPTVVSNWYGAANTIAERFAAGNFREAWYATKGMALAQADGLKAAKMAYQTSGVRSTFQGAVGKVINTAGVDTMVALDAYTQTTVAKSVIYAEALRAADTLGLTGAARARHIRDIVDNTGRYPDIMKIAQETAQMATYQNALGPFASKFASMARDAGPGQMWFMFMKSPINLVKYGWNRTPVLQMMSKQLYADILAGGARADMAIGRMTIANFQAMMVFELAKEGSITGGGPSNPELRKAWLLTHQPYSVRTSKGWMSYKAYQPVAEVVGLIADLAEIHDQLDTPTAGQLAMAAGFAIMNNMADQTAWHQLSDVVEVAQGIKKGEHLTKHRTDIMLAPLESTATGGTIPPRIAGVMDPVTRDARNLHDEVMKRIAGWSKEVPPMRDGFNDVVIPAQPPGSPWFGLFYPLVPKFKPIETDPVKIEASKLEAKLPYYPDYIGREAPRGDFDIRQPLPGDSIPVQLTPQQRDRWQQIARNIIRGTKDPVHGDINPGIQRGLLDQPGYRKMPNGDPTPRALQRELFTGFMNDAKSSAEEYLLIEDKELAAKVYSAEANSVLPTVSESDKADVRQQYREGFDMFKNMSEDEKNNLARYGILQPDEPVDIGGQRYYTPAEPPKAKPKPTIELNITR